MANGQCAHIIPIETLTEAYKERNTEGAAAKDTRLTEQSGSSTEYFLLKFLTNRRRSKSVIGAHGCPSVCECATAEVSGSYRVALAHSQVSKVKFLDYLRHTAHINDIGDGLCGM